MEEEIKRNWNCTRFRPPCDQLISDVMNDRRQTALQNLARRYQRFSNIALVMIFWSLLIFYTEVYPEPTRLYTSIALGSYFLIVSIMDYWLYRGVRSINLVEMDMRSVMVKAAFYRKRHLQFVAILLPLAIGLVIFIFWQFTGQQYMIAGIAFGLIIGLAIGSRQLMKFMADYRAIMRNLN